MWMIPFVPQILDYVATLANAQSGNAAYGKMSGANLKERTISAQLLGVAEDLYLRLGYIKKGFWDQQQALDFWDTTKQTSNVNNAGFGVFVYLDNLEKFWGKQSSGGALPKGYFTTAGCSIGECKLFVSLHALVLCEEGVLNNHAAVKAFYDRFLAEPATAAVMAAHGGADKTQYFFKAAA